MNILNKFLLSIVLAILLLTFVQPNASAQADKNQEQTQMKTLPPKQPTRTAKIDVKHIGIDLRFDWKKQQAIGSATITLSPLASSSEVLLDAAQLSINSVALQDGKALDFHYTDENQNENLKINLDRVYESNENVTIKIDYRTNWVNKADPNNIWSSFGKGIRFQGPTSTTPVKRRQVWSAGEPESNRYWFPGYDAPNDLRTTELIATVEKPLTVVSNGKLIETKENEDGTRTFHYKASKPYPNYLTSFAVGEYVPVHQKAGDIEIMTYGYQDETEAVVATVELLPEMVEFFSERIGIKYPFERYTQVVVQDYPFPGPVGQHTASIMSDNMIDDARTHADFLYLWDSVEAQSLANQWFGNLITPKSWEHIWLSKSFSRYFDGLFNIHANGMDEFLTYYVSNDTNWIMNDWKSGDRHPIVTQHYDDVNQFTSDNYAKLRGGLVLRMLHHELGDENWWKVIRHYVRTNANRQVTTDDFQAAIETVTGDPLDWFFDQWIYRMGHPVFKVSRDFDESKQVLTVTVKQTQTLDANDPYPQVKFFQGKLAIKVDDKIEQVRLAPQLENVFQFKVASDPKLVNFDHQDFWIKEVDFDKPLQELLHQLQHDDDVLGQRFAMQQLDKLAADSNTDATVKDKITAAFQVFALSDSYWRVRNGALSTLQKSLQNQSGAMSKAGAKGSVPLKLDESTEAMLKKLAHDKQAWVRTSAISFLGRSHDEQHAELYLEALKDESDRVINAAAVALGRSKSSLAFDALVKLKDKPSWKSQSLIGTLDGLRELGDSRGFEIAKAALLDRTLPRWWLASPTWDYPIAAVATINALGQSESVYPILLERFEDSFADDDYNDIFANVLLIADLGDPRGERIFTTLRGKFKKDKNAMEAIEQYESRFNTSIENKSKNKAQDMAQRNGISTDWNSPEARQFDFWIGSWDVNLRAIQTDNSWKETIKAHAKVYAVLDGKAILELWNSPTVKGFSLRYYDPKKKKWVLYLDWPDNNESSFSLLEGTFRHGRGEFVASDGKTTRRYTFCDITPTSLRWDDAYTKNGKSWTYDWIMEFSRTEALPQWSEESRDAHTFQTAGSRCKGHEKEFALIDSVAGQWQGEVEIANGDSNEKVAATATAYRILDGCAVIQFSEYELDGKTFRNFSMLTYNAVKKRFEELSLDNRVGTSAQVRYGKLVDGELHLSPKRDEKKRDEKTGNELPQTKIVWKFPSAENRRLAVSTFALDGSQAWQPTSEVTLMPKLTPDSKLKLSDAINPTCPRSGKAVVATSLTFYRGHTVGFCNQHCRDDFAGDIAGSESDRKFFDKIIEGLDK